MSTKSNLLVTPRGQITLPSTLRKKFGIGKGGMLTVEERNGEIILRPATVLEIEMYSDDQIAEWNAEDKIEQATKTKIKKKLGK